MTTRNILNNFVDESNISQIIIDYLGYECEKCKEIQQHQLKVGLSFTKGYHNLVDSKNSDYKLKKFCDTCIFSRCSSIPIYLEINHY